MFIDGGKQILFDTKDNVLDGHALVKGAKEDLTDDLKARLIGVKTSPLGFCGLCLRSKLRSDDRVETEKPTLEDVMVYYTREEIEL